MDSGIYDLLMEVIFGQDVLFDMMIDAGKNESCWIDGGGNYYYYELILDDQLVRDGYIFYFINQQITMELVDLYVFNVFYVISFLYTFLCKNLYYSFYNFYNEIIFLLFI